MSFNEYKAYSNPIQIMTIIMDDGTPILIASLQDWFNEVLLLMNVVFNVNI